MAIWYLLIGTRGGETRTKILQVLDQQPRNTNQIAEEVNLDYKTVKHHLDVLQENNIVKDSGHDYGAVYLLTQRVEENWDMIEGIIKSLET
ncbi:winged helix-turn-helix transcriptional regulator [Halostella sp. JP-L12]|nr:MULTISPECIES: winged helix-turn-helix domain-containing protein [Halostella]NHN46818.1 winged helix-turn-helix transcriptional regulator [Halostella sp. JP-L12]